MSLLVSVIISVSLIPAGPILLRMFNDTPAVIEAGMAYLYRILPFYGLLALLFTINGIIRGAGEMIIPMFSTLLSLWLVRVPSAYLMVQLFGRDNMFFGYAVGWIVGLSISGIYYLSGKWKNKIIVKPTDTITFFSD